MIHRRPTSTPYALLMLVLAVAAVSAYALGNHGLLLILLGIQYATWGVDYLTGGTSDESR